MQPRASAYLRRTPRGPRRAALAGLGLLVAVAGGAPAPAARAGLTFTDVTDEAGLSMVQHTGNEPPDCLLYNGIFCEPERMTGGAAVGDVDGDGIDDLFLTRLEADDVLLRNRGDGTFEDITAAAGLAGLALDSNGAGFGDVDGDGDLDLVVTTLGDASRFYLFINDGSGVFSEEAQARGVALDDGLPHVGYGVAFGDYDRDGWIDLVTSEWRAAVPTTGGVIHTRLFHNRGAAMPGYFDDVTVAAGVDLVALQGLATWVFAPAFVDLDQDGWPDLTLTSDFGTSHLFWNEGGAFVDGTAAAGVGTDENGMGSTFGDVDGDGDLDWFVTSIFDPADTCSSVPCGWGGTGNRLYRNEGNRVFSDATDEAGVRDGYWGWGTAFFDADNDGDLDLVMTNGVDFPESQLPAPAIDDPWEADPMRFWRNDGNGVMTEESASVGLTDTGSGKGLVTFDYDRDGDLDVLVVNNQTGPRLYRNDGDDPGDWLRVRLVALDGNTEALGALVRVRTVPPFRWRTREMNTVSHFLGQGERVAHFGLGETPGLVYQVAVRWPRHYNWTVTYLVRTNQEVVIHEPVIECSDGLDNDGDGLVDLADPRCHGHALGLTETEETFCGRGAELLSALPLLWIGRRRRYALAAARPRGAPAGPPCRTA